ncbi:MAG: orotidine 5'-phosphate decarboxylase [Candidatus ainarchaeum sp.]|nr:orotidine 5'-phosphate decarboxylase [Candidatus ainarchaeum sp.]
MKIQVALDFSDLKQAIAIAKEVEEYVDIIEAGTPLIKSEGMNAVVELKKRFPKKKIVADMKTMDTGAFEAEIAINAGADIITVLGAADDKTIKDAIETAEKNKKECVVDLINTSPERWKEIEKLKPHYLGFHVGIDQQKKGVNVLEQIINLKEKRNIKIAVAGGINKDKIKSIADKKVDIIIVGGAITRSENPKNAAKEICEELNRFRKI